MANEEGTPESSAAGDSILDEGAQPIDRHTEKQRAGRYEMSKVHVVEGAVIPDRVMRQMEEEEREQQAEIAAQKVRQAARAAEEGLEGEPQPEPVAPDQPTPEPTPAVQPAPVVADAEARARALEAQLQLERQRNQTLQGKINALGPQTAQAVREMREELAALKRERQAPPAPTIAPYLQHLKDEEREVYAGQEAPPEVRMARGEIDAVAAQLRAEFAAQRAELDDIRRGNTEQQHASHASRVMAEVEKQVPHASAINADPAFDAWLDGADPRSITGSSLRDRGETCMSRGDATGVSELMKEFLGTGLVSDPRVMAQIKPGMSSVTPVVKPPQVVRIPESEASQFFQDKVRGKCVNADGSPMSQAKIEEIEKAINLAMDEGRIILGR